MKIFTRQLLADEASKRFSEQYGRAYKLDQKTWTGVTFREVFEKLDALPSSPDPDEVDRIIGNTSWTALPKCDECGKDNLSAVIEVGEPQDFDSNTASLCIECLRKAAQLLDTL